MRHRLPWIIACSLLLYRWLLALTPSEFADEYTEPALQVFHQCCREAYRERGTWGVLRLWLPTFLDALHGIVAEQGITLKRGVRSHLTWLAVLALSCVLFPFSWLSKAWEPFGYLFNLIFSTPQTYIVGHVTLFCLTGIIVLLFMPALRKRARLYIFCLMLGAFAEEVIQILFNAHSGLHKDARNLLLDLCGVLLALLVLRLLMGKHFLEKNMSDATLRNR